MKERSRDAAKKGLSGAIQDHDQPATITGELAKEVSDSLVYKKPIPVDQKMSSNLRWETDLKL